MANSLEPFSSYFNLDWLLSSCAAQVSSFGFHSINLGMCFTFFIFGIHMLFYFLVYIVLMENNLSGFSEKVLLPVNGFITYLLWLRVWLGIET